MLFVAVHLKINSVAYKLLVVPISAPLWHSQTKQSRAPKQAPSNHRDLYSQNLIGTIPQRFALLASLGGT